MMMENPVDKQKLFIVIWAVFIGIIIVKIDLVDLYTWEFWVIALTLNLIGFYIYYVSGNSTDNNSEEIE